MKCSRSCAWVLQQCPMCPRGNLYPVSDTSSSKTQHTDLKHRFCCRNRQWQISNQAIGGSSRLVCSVAWRNWFRNGHGCHCSVCFLRWIWREKWKPLRSKRRHSSWFVEKAENKQNHNHEQPTAHSTFLIIWVIITRSYIRRKNESSNDHKLTLYFLFCYFQHSKSFCLIL